MKLELADTFFKRLRGLSGRKTITSDGMLFVFPFRHRWGIWMRGMHFPIDIIWLDRGRIVGRDFRPLPRTWREAYRVSSPPVPVDMVVELPRTV